MSGRLHERWMAGLSEEERADEEYADVFARNLLMPAKQFRKAWREHGRSAPIMAAVFRVPIDRVWERVRELKLPTKQVCHRCDGTGNEP